LTALEEPLPPSTSLYTVLTDGAWPVEVAIWLVGLAIWPVEVAIWLVEHQA
jgi:hypothetical protein